jgi:formylglycine-generating enzyme required for sulfatase activity
MWQLALIGVGFVLSACDLFQDRKKTEIEPEPLGKCPNGYCEIPGGSFQMGSTSGDLDAQPVKTVTMTGFQLGQTEVSVGQYREFLAKSGTQLNAVIFGIPENQKGDNYPVVGLVYDEKRAYCQAQGGDLPTAAQLHFTYQYHEQYSTTKGKDQRVILDNGFRSTEPVDDGYKNRFGVFNLRGNVWESTRDRYESDFYSRMVSKDPYNPLTDQKTQWEEFTDGLFSHFQGPPPLARRRFSYPNLRAAGAGFRCARPLPQDSPPKAASKK